MLAHLFTFLVAIRELSDTGHTLMAVASGLFFVETGAFLLVVTAFRREVTLFPQGRHLYIDEEFD